MANCFLKRKDFKKEFFYKLEVGFNPKKHSYFFDRETGNPVIAGEEALQVGPLVLVKNAVIGNRKDFKFAVGGLLNTLKMKVA